MYTEASTEIANRLWHWVERNNHDGQSFQDAYSKLAFQKNQESQKEVIQMLVSFKPVVLGEVTWHVSSHYVSGTVPSTLHALFY